MAESENIRTNHLEFTKFLFQQYSQQLGLNNNHFPVESVFNFYINNKITDCLGRTANKSNHLKVYTTTIPNYLCRQKKGKTINTSIKSPTNLSYHYTPGSAINISSIDFGNMNPWKIMESEEREEEKESKDQKFTYQNPITENLEPFQLPQQQIVAPIAYAPIAKLKKFTGKEDNAQVNIPPATINENKSLDAIFPFELEELSATPLFSKATLKEKPITIMYTDAKVNGHLIKLILDSRSVGSIITRQLMAQLDCQVDQTAST
ncbi:hypothetical protein G9A89_010402 [Geosiphon pyriformis]|nr:hypothetical protein G9A89_010402 [Geosiphon pyriformis]